MPKNLLYGACNWDIIKLMVVSLIVDTLIGSIIDRVIGPIIERPIGLTIVRVIVDYDRVVCSSVSLSQID